MMGLPGDFPVWSYLSLTVVALCCVRNAGGVLSTQCPPPKALLVVTKGNERNLTIDSTSYTATAVSLPVKCVSEAFIPQDDVKATCKNGIWKLPKTKCVPLIYRERKVTNTIMAITGAVGGVLAAAFIIVKVICYRRSSGKGQRGSVRHDDIEMTSDGRVSTMSRNLPVQTDRQSAHLYTQSVVSGRTSQHTQPTYNHDGRALRY
ncbi:uncharacterized protein LOC124264289 [Haliotis rubra]|uniref:uncharacterized protein LOC124264289 n=1 Tax=Haliotis rubra TaxID=36100 RepID=UPI001EE533F4|nr:uncharacterized protein LOC124264289 [Haliotis rubra]